MSDRILADPFRMAAADPETPARIALLARAGGERPVVLVDGGSGAGKTTLARAVAPLLDAQLVSLDDLYPGWAGLAAGSAAVADEVLHPGRPGWRRWDWAASRPAERHELDPALPLVIEGCGALSRANRALATLGVWVDLDEAERKRRALARDPDTFPPHWDEWAAQERAFRAAEPPLPLADVVVDGR